MQKQKLTACSGQSYFTISQVIELLERENDRIGILDLFDEQGILLNYRHPSAKMLKNGYMIESFREIVTRDGFEGLLTKTLVSIKGLFYLKRCIDKIVKQINDEARSK